MPHAEHFFNTISVVTYSLMLERQLLSPRLVLETGSYIGSGRISCAM